MVVQRLSVILTLSLLLYPCLVSTKDSGPYKVILETIRNCAAKGTGEISITSSARKDSNGQMFHSGSLKMPYGLTDNFKAQGDASIWRDNQWKPIGVVWKLNFPKACSSKKSLVPVWFDILRAASLRNIECQIPKGNYNFVNYHVDGSIKGVNTLKYGKYRARLTYIRQGKVIGCIAYIAQIVPA